MRGLRPPSPRGEGPRDAGPPGPPGAEGVRSRPPRSGLPPGSSGDGPSPGTAAPANPQAAPALPPAHTQGLVLADPPGQRPLMDHSSGCEIQTLLRRSRPSPVHHPSIIHHPSTRPPVIHLSIIRPLVIHPSSTHPPPVVHPAAHTSVCSSVRQPAMHQTPCKSAKDRGDKRRRPYPLVRDTDK